MSDPILDITGLGHAYEGVPCLRDVNLRVDAGELVTLLGASGCGKTTLLRAVAGFVLPASGSIRVAGTEVVAEGVERAPAERRGVGLVFQDYALFPHMSVAENVAFGVHDHPDRGSRVDELLEMVRLSEHRQRRPAALSGGQQQRVALARALAPRPSLLLLDEPFANLDASLRAGLRAELMAVLQRVGAAALLVTHHREEALSVADRVVVLGDEAGRPGAGATVLRQGPPLDVYRDPRSRAVAELTGEASFLVDDEGSLTVLRPEEGRFEVDPTGDATVTGRQLLGGRYALTLDTPQGRAVVEAEVSEAAAPGERGWLRRIRAGAPLNL